jgi:hypothetical protein
MPLTRSHLADLLSDSIGLSKREARDLVAAFYDELISALDDLCHTCATGTARWLQAESMMVVFS